MFRARASVALSALVLFAAATAFTVSPAAPARADGCIGSWSIGVGGLAIGLFGFGEDSTYLAADQPVGYNSADPMSGLRELDRLFWQHRNACPDDQVTLIGHSEGAGIIHAWVTAHQDVENANAILLSDPKRVAGPGSAGLSGDPLAPLVGYPLAGVDDDFGDFPVLQVCNHDDVICNEEAGWFGYLTGAHGRYDYSSQHYSDDVSGVWFR
ncbi:cutinase family protein [Nocardia sp. NPDC049707]|uniref:cutinase family protein n=1 Tax=Nocardia sp. NPDC049707 TaxID=3154735 RepID=UPI00342E008B